MKMKVKDLISLLNECPDKDMDVYLSKDPEGNGYKPLDGHSFGSIVDDDDDHIVDFSDMRERDYYNKELGWEFEEMDELPVVLVLWP
jgi:hypothetical protein